MTIRQIAQLTALACVSVPAWSQSASITLKTGATVSAWVENDVSSQPPRKTICFMYSGQKSVEIAWKLHGLSNIAGSDKGTVLVKPLPHKQGLVHLHPIDKDKLMGVVTLTLSVPEREY